MTLLIRKHGMLSTLQDLGRTGYRRFGINPNGVMDTAAARAINTLLGNDANTPVIEMHFPACEIEFQKACCFAIAGGDLAAELNGISIANWAVHFAGQSSILTFRKRVLGSRAYLAVKGGFHLPKWLGSGSTNLTASRGGLDGRPLRKGDRLDCKESSDVPPRKLSRSLIPRYSRFPTVRVIAGPEFDWLSQVSQTRLAEQSYTISNNSNRMGYRLTAEPLERAVGDEMVSSGVTFGTIQLLPDGQLIVLMADHQTTGGYPRVANVVAADLPLLAQIGTGDGVGFHFVSHEAALEIYLDVEGDFNLLRVGCMFG